MSASSTSTICQTQTTPKLKDDLLRHYQKRVEVLKAMAHPTRLFILDTLLNGPLCVCEINALIDADVSTISKHLLLLRNAGLVSYEKKGLQVFYKLETPCILNSLSCVEDALRN